MARRDISSFLKVSREKIKSLKDLMEILRRLRADENRIVFTNGCFDLIHPGHIRLLEMARRQGDCLVLALNTDASIRRIKGEKRPLLDQDQRGRIMASMEAVDFVIFFEEDTPERIIREIKPDVLLKGGEYNMDEVVGRQSVWDTGGTVLVVKPVPGRSTSAIIKEIVTHFSK